jgi:hypothetical protein
MRSSRTAPLLRFKISESSDRLAGDLDANVLRGAIRVADQGCYSPGVEDTIKITTCCLGSIGQLVTGSLDLCAGIMGLLQTSAASYACCSRMP